MAKYIRANIQPSILKTLWETPEYLTSTEYVIYLKQCSKCGETKDQTHFSKAKLYRDGLKSWCKECVIVNLKRYKK